MKSQKGSITVIALIMLLFLVILSGAWLVMMTQEKTNAYADEKQQQAWYAAEAGYKRAAMLIYNKNKDWANIITTFENIKENDESNFQKIAMNLGSVPAKGPWYAFSIRNGNNNLTEAPNSDTTYTITSVGEYMGERKVISRSYTLGKNTGSSSPSTPTTVSPTKVASEGVINALNVDMTNNGGGKNLKSGQIYYESTLTNSTNAGDKITDEQLKNTTPGYSSTYFTDIPSFYFKSKDDVIATGATHFLSQYGSIHSTKIEENGVYYIDSNSVIDYKGDVNSNSIGVNITGNTDDTGVAGVTIYVYDNMWSKIQNIIGPTASNSVPVTIIVVNDSAATMSVITQGRVRMLFKSDITFSGGSKKGYFMAMTNGNMNFNSQATTHAFLSASGDILISGGNFTGQVMCKGTVTVSNQDTTLDNSILSDKLFWLSEWS